MKAHLRLKDDFCLDAEVILDERDRPLYKFII